MNPEDLTEEEWKILKSNKNKKNGEKYTLVQLSTEQAEQFIDFQKYYTLFGLLNSINAFDIKDGNVTINFNHMGEIKTVEKHEYYRT